MSTPGHSQFGALRIATTTDEAYTPYCAAMLHSLLVRNPRAQVHLLLPPEYPDAARRSMGDWVRDLRASITFHAIPDADVRDLPSLRGVDRLVWYRLFLDDLLPGVERVLYLDADTLVVDDLGPLWETPLDDHAIAAVQNVTAPELEPHLTRLGLPDASRAFNTGVLLMNLEAMRADAVRHRVLEFARNADFALEWADQDALNAVLWPRCRILHPRWNCQNSLFYWPKARTLLGHDAVDAATRNPAILHFEGPEIVKPWHYMSRHPFRERYLDHLRATPWSDTPLWGGTPLHRLLRWFPESVAHRYWALRHRRGSSGR